MFVYHIIRFMVRLALSHACQANTKSILIFINKSRQYLRESVSQNLCKYVVGIE